MAIFSYGMAEILFEEWHGLQIKVCFETCKFLYIFMILISRFFLHGPDLNSGAWSDQFVFLTVEIDMALLHSGMFGKRAIGHGPSIILLIL